ncbi:MAG TPA: DUF2961 domain-containing protein [Phycisphaerae bacterium]|nr:DUF2961 domain-containing protein [Phycisphaerae bacterium]
MTRYLTLAWSGLAAAFLSACSAGGEARDVSALARLTPGRTAAQNALWIETPLERQFKSGKRVVVADIAGPAEITMIHFAVGVNEVSRKGPLNRDLLIRMYWDGEEKPSVEAPLVDFFCDPAGLRDRVDSALVNKKRGFNCYFPMPFRKSGRVELVYDGPIPAGDKLWSQMPCYSYVMYRTLAGVPEDVGYFHACWRQESLLLGKVDYLALDAKGKGKFIGWNVTMRNPGKGGYHIGGTGYPVDQNEKFYIDGEAEPSIELQGIEDSFGFSWGFPEAENMFPYTGWFPFFKGAAAYRWFIQDAIRFEKSLKVTIGFGKNENPAFRRDFSKPENRLQLSSTCYWYQTEPHADLPPMPDAKDRAPAPDEPFKEKLPSVEELKKRGVKLEMLAGRPGKEVIFAEHGYDAVAKKGFAYAGWSMPVYHCRADEKDLQIELTVPKGAEGTVRVYVIDPDEFEGGRKEELIIAGRSLGVIEKFQEGRWLEQRLDSGDTAGGRVLIEARNVRAGSNAVISIVEWVEGK